MEEARELAVVSDGDSIVIASRDAIPTVTLGLDPMTHFSTTPWALGSSPRVTGRGTSVHMTHSATAPKPPHVVIGGAVPPIHGEICKVDHQIKTFEFIQNDWSGDDRGGVNHYAI